jgi:hypothetical protein
MGAERETAMEAAGTTRAGGGRRAASPVRETVEVRPTDEAATARLPRALQPAVAVLRTLQQTVGNTAVAQRLALQRQYDMREHVGHSPLPPFHEIHFRFDTETLSDHPHEFLHVTFQDAAPPARQHLKHYYYDSWTDQWRVSGAGPSPVSVSDLAQVKAAAIAWGEQKAKGYGTQFRRPDGPKPQEKVKASDFVQLGSLSQQEIEKRARAKAREDQLAEQKRLKQEAHRLRQEQEKARVEAARQAKAAEAARKLAEKKAAEAERKAYQAALANLAYAIHLAFDYYTLDEARVRAAEILAGDEQQAQPVRPMSEDALSMYG